MLDIAKDPTRPIALDLQDVHKSYGSLAVLKGVSLTAYDGDVISILGSSGSGKSTLLRCINLLEKPNQGRIIIGNDELMLKPAKSGELQAVDIKQLENLRARVVLSSKTLTCGRTKRFCKTSSKGQRKF